MTMLKTAGLCLMAAGTLLLLYTIIKAKRDGTLDDIKELGKIRRSGYTREHHEENRSSAYKPESAVDHSKMMSRRAQRVLERMEEKEAEEAALQMTPKESRRRENELKEPAVKKEKAAGSPSLAGSEAMTDILPGDKAASPSREEATAMLEQEEATAMLEQEDATDVLPEPDDETAMLPSEDATCLLKETEQNLSSEAATSLLSDEPLPASGSEAATNLLGSGADDPPEDSTATLEEESPTDLLGEATAILDQEV